jgi:hypothetical protein
MENYPKSFRPKWSFVKSIPGQEHGDDGVLGLGRVAGGDHVVVVVLHSLQQQSN